MSSPILKTFQLQLTWDQQERVQEELKELDSAGSEAPKYYVISQTIHSKSLITFAAITQEAGNAIAKILTPPA